MGQRFHFFLAGELRVDLLVLSLCVGAIGALPPPPPSFPAFPRRPVLPTKQRRVFG